MTATGGDVLVAALRSAGIDTVFGLPGFQLDSVFDALARDGSIRVVTTRHEQATSYMADGYARASGRVGVCLVVPGPGFLNAMAGLATAYACNSQVLCVAGQVDSDLIDQGLGLVHEIPGQLQAARSVAKFALRAMSVPEVATGAREALARIAEGRPRPVVLEVPLDVLSAEAPMPDVLPPASERAAPDARLIDEAAELLRKAERPLIVAGGGVLTSGAWDELRATAEHLRAPVIMTMNAKGALPADHPLAFEAHTFDALLPAADAILAVGTRFARHLGRRRRLEAGQKMVRIDADREELTRSPSPTIAIESDAGLGLRDLNAALGDRPAAAVWSGLDEIRREAQAVAASFLPQAEYGRVLVEELPADSVVVAGMTQLGYWMRIGYPVRHPRTWLTPGYQATLGFELPTGLGAQVARPDRRVVVVAGDGGLMFNIQELATAVQHRIPAIVLVFNDNAYGNVRRIQANRYGGRLIASELHNPDFVRLAESFGVLGIRAESPDELRTGLRRALAEPGPVLIEAPVGEMSDPWSVLLRS